MCGGQVELLQQRLSGVTLQGGKTKLFSFIMPDDKLHTTVAKIAYAVKKYNGVGYIHQAKIVHSSARRGKG